MLVEEGNWLEMNEEGKSEFFGRDGGRYDRRRRWMLVREGNGLEINGEGWAWKRDVMEKDEDWRRKIQKLGEGAGEEKKSGDEKKIVVFKKAHEFLKNMF